MSVVSPDEFAAFFAALHGHPPYPWQQRLAGAAADGRWPRAIDLPTGAGKTSCIDIAVFALACQAGRAPAERTAPVRVFFCVNRRVIVDEAHRRARRIAERLLEAEGNTEASDILRRVAAALRQVAGTSGQRDVPPLDVLELRGGVYRDNRWARSPVQPTVVCTTVDQLGSRLLFRGYGVSPQAAPIQAALIAWDALVLLDEAHISRPFLQTLDAVRGYLAPERWAEDAPAGRPMRVVPMTATPPHGSREAGAVVRIDAGDRKVELLERRLTASKRAELRIARKKLEDEIVRAALELVGEEPIALAVMVNRVALAREVWRRLREDARLNKGHPDAVIELVIGAMRPVDRDEQSRRLDPLVGSGRPPETGRTCIVVSTQCLEVGADYDFDALVTECASLDALRQRFGRLNRAGRPVDARAVIVIEKSQVKAAEKLKEDRPLDPIYGNAIARTWNWLVKRGGGGGVVDFGIDAMADVDLGAHEMAGLLAPSARSEAPVLLPSHLDFWVQTAPPPVPDPDVALFLHGPRRASLDVQVCWRADLEGDETSWCETVALLPPSSAECMTVPLPRLRRWLAAVEEEDATGDLLGIEETAGDGDDSSKPDLPRGVIWRGRNDSKLLDDLAELRPGDTLVLPVSGAGWDALGHIPAATEEEHGDSAGAHARVDAAERAFRLSRARPALRLRSVFRHLWPVGPEWDELFAAASDPDVELSRREWEELLHEARDATEDDSSARRILDELLSAGVFARRYPDRNGVVLCGRRRLPDIWWLPASDEGDDALSRIQRSVPVPLGEHLEHVRDALSELAGRLPVDAWRDALEAAALLHDVGKADERFQAMLLGADRTLAWLRIGRTSGGEPIAKSESMPRTWAECAAAAARAGVPPGFRHEMLSVQLAENAAHGLLPEDPWQRDLALHLIAAHHGYARPFAPVIPDPDPPAVSLRLRLADRLVDFGELTADWRRSHPPHRIDSGIAERFWRLVRRHGWWGLAWFEAVMRLADQRASSREDRDEPTPALASGREDGP
ncbi:MAG: hypothetical protein Kow0062_19570 [Acidobacteriota bacterium]